MDQTTENFMKKKIKMNQIKGLTRKMLFEGIEDAFFQKEMVFIIKTFRFHIRLWEYEFYRIATQMISSIIFSYVRLPTPSIFVCQLELAMNSECPSNTSILARNEQWTLFDVIAEFSMTLKCQILHFIVWFYSSRTFPREHTHFSHLCRAVSYNKID